MTFRAKNGKPDGLRTLGRPTKYSEEVVERLCDALADGMPIKGACVVAGIGVTTLAEWREKYPRLEDRMSEARELARQNALQAIKAAGEKDWRAKAEWLRLTFPEDYRGSGHKVEVQQAVQVQVSQGQLEDLRRRLPAARKLVEASNIMGEDAHEIDVESSRQESCEIADSAHRPPQPAPLNYAGQPMRPGEPYGGRTT
jgi:hypothetical protein